MTVLAPVSRFVLTGPGATGTWTKRADARVVRVRLVGGGGGGGSGQLAATGAQRAGGGGGGAGMYVDAWYAAADLPSSVLCTVGAGGSGGACITTPDTTGNNGATGTPSTFGTLLRAWGQVSVGGGGNTSFAITGGAPPAGARINSIQTIPRMGSGQRALNNLIGTAATAMGSGNQPGGGGAGGAATNTNTGVTAGKGLNNLAVDDLRQQPQTINTGLQPTPVTPATLAGTAYGQIPWYSGAGGANGPTGGGTGGVGGDAQGYGAGGGGGAGGTNGSASGTGGRGGDGLVIVETFA